MKSESTDSSIIFTAFFVLCAVVCPPSILMVFVFFLSGASLANGQQTCTRPKEKFYLIIPSHLVFTLFGTCEGWFVVGGFVDVCLEYLFFGFVSTELELLRSMAFPFQIAG